MNLVLETDRLLLRRFELQDYKDVYTFGSNEEVNRYTGDVPISSYENAKKLIYDVWLNDYENYGYGRLAVIHKADNKLIGFAGLKFLPELNETDLGYRLLPRYWGKGLATEASQKIVDYGKNDLRLKRIIGIAMAENPASSRVLEKVGFKWYKVDGYDGDEGEHNWYEIIFS